MLNSYHLNHYQLLSQINEGYNDVGDLYIYSNLPEDTFENVINIMYDNKLVIYDKIKNSVTITDLGIKVLNHLKYIFPRTVSLDKHNPKLISPKGNLGWFESVKCLDDDCKEIPELSKLYSANITEYNLIFLRTLAGINNSLNRSDLQTYLNSRDKYFIPWIEFLIKNKIIEIEGSNVNKKYDTFKLTDVGIFLLTHLRELFYEEHIVFPRKDN